jgi:hypothetical protein
MDLLIHTARFGSNIGIGIKGRAFENPKLIAEREIRIGIKKFSSISNA